MRTPPPRRARSGDRSSYRAAKPKSSPGGPAYDAAESDTRTIKTSSQETDPDIPVASRTSAKQSRDPNRSKSETRRKRGGTSDVPIEKVAYGLYALIVVFGWCAMASAYESDTVGRPTVLETSNDAVSGLFMVLAMVWTFLRASVVHLLSLPTVLLHTISNHQLILAAMVAAVAAVYGFVRLTDRVNAEIRRGYEKSAHRRRRLR